MKHYFVLGSCSKCLFDLCAPVNAFVLTLYSQTDSILSTCAGLSLLVSVRLFLKFGALFIGFCFGHSDDL